MVEIGIEPLVRLLGFTGLEDVRYREHTAAATLGGPRTVAVLIAGWADPLDGLWRLAVVEARRREAGWCLLFNGLHIRLVDAGRVYSRRYVDLDLDEAADEAPTAAALWTLCAAPAFVREPDGTTQIRRLVTASERHGADVCRSLRAGVLDASADVMRALLVGQPRDRSGAFEQALTIVYRILFLLFAEARALVPLWHPVYRESYSLDALRDGGRTAARRHRASGTRCARSRRLAHAGCRAGDLRVTPFNGRLFAPARTPLAERRDLDDDAARRAVLALSHAARRRSRGPRADRLPRSRRRAARRGVRDAARLRAARRQRTSAAPSAVALERGSGARERRPARSTRRSRSPTTSSGATLAPLVRDATPERILAAPRARSGDGQRRVSRRRVPLSGATRTKRRSFAPAAATRATSAPPNGPRSAGRSPSAVCTASI